MDSASLEALRDGLWRVHEHRKKVYTYEIPTQVTPAVNHTDAYNSPCNSRFIEPTSCLRYGGSIILSRKTRGTTDLIYTPLAPRTSRGLCYYGERKGAPA